MSGYTCYRRCILELEPVILPAPDMMQNANTSALRTLAMDPNAGTDGDDDVSGIYRP